MDAKKLGKKIKMARIELDLNQAELAKKIGAKQKSISRYETGMVSEKRCLWFNDKWCQINGVRTRQPLK